MYMNSQGHPRAYHTILKVFTMSYLKMNQLSLRNIRFKSETVGTLPIILKAFIEYTTFQVSLQDKYVHMCTVKLVNTKMSTRYAQ